jgi:hypothetical protein
MIRDLALGATAMYFFDPRLGRTRRAHLRDRVRSLGNDLLVDYDKAKRDLVNRTRGTFAVFSNRFDGSGADDRKLHDRVRAELGRHTTHSGAIDVIASGGCVTLCGPVLASEVQDLVESVRKVRGVQDVRNELIVHEDAGDIPSLQGHGVLRNPAAASMWTPATRLLATTGGGLAVLRGLLGRGPAGGIYSILGIGLIARAVTNCPFGGMFSDIRKYSESRTAPQSGGEVPGDQPIDQPQKTWLANESRWE